MIADSGGGYINGTDESHQNASRDLRRATSLLRLLKSGDEESQKDPELQKEFHRLRELLERIDRLAEGVEQTAGSSENGASAVATNGAAHQGDALAHAHSSPEHDPAKPDAGETPPVAGGESRQSGQPSTWPEQPASTPASSTDSGFDPSDERCMRWWIHFNGDLSLERLSKLRTHLNDSPFTIDTRYDEITDGLIVMRVVTEEHISMDQINWILRQLMDLVGLDRNSAIVSQQ